MCISHQFRENMSHQMCALFSSFKVCFSFEYRLFYQIRIDQIFLYTRFLTANVNDSKLNFAINISNFIYFFEILVSSSSQQNISIFAQQKNSTLIDRM